MTTILLVSASELTDYTIKWIQETPKMGRDFKNPEIWNNKYTLNIILESSSDFSVKLGISLK